MKTITVHPLVGTAVAFGYSAEAFKREVEVAFDGIAEDLGFRLGDYWDSNSEDMLVLVELRQHDQFPAFVAQHYKDAGGAHHLYFDPRAKWDIGFLRSLFNSRANFRTYLLHEFGHGLGLKHSTDPDSIMFPKPPLTRRLRDRDKAMFKAAMEAL